MPIPSKVLNAGNNTANATNVFRVAFTQALSVAPQFQMWDNSSTFPLVDAAGTTVVKEAFTGTTGNSSKPEYALYASSSAGPGGSLWLPASATGGSANPNRMKGTTNFVNDPTTPGAVLAVPGAASYATAAGTNLGIGAYKYQITFVNAIGETTGGTESTITTTTGNTNVSITAIPTGAAGTTKRGIYRTQVGGATGTEKFVAYIGDNTTTTYTDSATDASINSNFAVPTVNTTSGIKFNITAEFASDSAVPSSSSQNILLQVQYQYTGTAPTLSYWYNDASGTPVGTEAQPNWLQFTPGTHGIRLVNASTISGTYKFTLPASSTAYVTELWVTT